jgi:hypothetical protein
MTNWHSSSVLFLNRREEIERSQTSDSPEVSKALSLPTQSMMDWSFGISAIQKRLPGMLFYHVPSIYTRTLQPTNIKTLNFLGIFSFSCI